MARAVTFASGVIDILPSISEMQKLWSQGMIHHCIYCHGYEHRDGVLGALGTSPVTIHSLLGSTTLNKSMILLTNATLLDDKLRRKLVALNVHVVEDSIKSMSKDSNRIRVELKNGKVEEIDGLLHGPDSRVANGSLLISLGVVITDIMPGHVPVKTDDLLGRTAAPGVYVSGDMAGLARAIRHAMLTGAMGAAGLNADVAGKDVEHQMVNGSD